MASQAHCAYCFESLSASLDKRKALNLATTELLWNEYTDLPSNRQPEAETTAGAPRSSASRLPNPIPAISRLLSPVTPSSASSSSSPAPSASSSTPSLLSTPATTASNSSSNQHLAITEQREFPLFVTWDISTRSGQKNLRGCIGTFEPQDLDDGLSSYALTSAFDDTRFDPISKREFPSLHCSVTLLTNFEPASNPMDWEIGTHGIRISFTAGGRRFGATYLPDVAREQGWTKDETIISLMRKAGWGGHKSEWKKVPDLKVVRYQGKKCSLSYAEWRAWRDWVEETGQDSEVEV